MLMKKIYVDIISEKERKLHQLQADAESAVDIVTRAISGLELVNQEIEDTKSEIDEYISRLTEQRDTLVHNQKRNCVVIKNFSKLLAVDERRKRAKQHPDWVRGITTLTAIYMYEYLKTYHVSCCG